MDSIYPSLYPLPIQYYFNFLDICHLSWSLAVVWPSLAISQYATLPYWPLLNGRPEGIIHQVGNIKASLGKTNINIIYVIMIIYLEEELICSDLKSHKSWKWSPHYFLVSKVRAEEEKIKVYQICEFRNFTFVSGMEYNFEWFSLIYKISLST